MTRSRCAPAREVLAAQFGQRKNQRLLADDPIAISGDELVSCSVAADPERVRPFALVQSDAPAVDLVADIDHARRDDPATAVRVRDVSGASLEGVAGRIQTIAIGSRARAHLGERV
jgi:hypothetical protein